MYKVTIEDRIMDGIQEYNETCKDYGELDDIINEELHDAGFSQKRIDKAKDNAMKLELNKTIHITKEFPFVDFTITRTA